MKSTSDNSLRRWSIRTSYPSVARIPLPAEIDARSSAHVRRLEQDLNRTKRCIAKVHKTALCNLGHQRKLMETSMLKYSERMQEISDSRTTNLFKKIQERKGLFCGCQTDVNSEPELKHRLSDFWNQSEHCSEHNRKINDKLLNKDGVRTFYGIRNNRFSNILDETTSEKTLRAPRVSLPKLLLKRSSSADLLKHCSKDNTRQQSVTKYEEESLYTISRTHG